MALPNHKTKIVATIGPASETPEVGHAHKSLSGFIDERHPGQSGAVTGERSSNFIEKDYINEDGDWQDCQEEIHCDD
jgi:hypothetical protein